MRRALSITIGLVLWCAAAHAGERYAGFLTFGCGDRYIKLHNIPQTWYVNLSAAEERALFAQLNFEKDRYYSWTTVHVVLEATRRATARRGYFGVHPQQLEVERVISARWPKNGETVEAATAPARSYRGFLLVSGHGHGFVPLSQKDEAWWVVGDAADFGQIDKHFQPPPQDRIDSALVEIVGRVGPPGAYGAYGEYNREIAVDQFKFVRMVDVSEMIGTAAAPGRDTRVAINMCKPQAR